MKKILCLLLALGLLISTGSVYGLENQINPSSSYTVVTSFVLVHDVNTGNDTSTSLSGDKVHAAYVSLSEIDTNDLIIGYTVTANSPDKGAVASFYDITDTFTVPTGKLEVEVAEAFMVNSNLIVEVEVGADPGSTTVWFPYPTKITGRLGILTGTTYCTVTVWHINV